MTTASNLITAAMRTLGLVASGEAPTAAELQDGLNDLNAVIDMWATMPEMHFTETGESFTLSTKANYCIGDSQLPISSITRSGTTATAITSQPHGLLTGNKVTIAGATQADYNVTATITVVDAVTFTYTVANSPATPATGSPTATAGDFHTIRPLSVLGAFTREGAVDTPLALITEQYWTNLQDKQATGAVQSTLLYRPDYPFGQIFVYPIPTTTPALWLKSLKCVAPFTSLSEDRLLPPGYMHMLQVALAVTVASNYEAKIAQETIQRLQQAYNTILAANRQKLPTSKAETAGTQGA